MSIVGANIFLYRKRKGLTQEELAAKMGYKSKSSINKIELGINDIPQSKIKQFAEVLEVTPAELMGWTSDSSDDGDLSKDEKLVLELFRSVPNEKKSLVLAMIRAALNNQ